CNTLSQSETKGLGSRTTLPDFREQFYGKDSSLSGVDTISGATISSKAYIGAIKDAFSAYEIAKEAD
ncbi:MAG: FMN-binding protein, partial [Clostridia bacterium]|nr:FMN-binding protein [Clostridia bacterium]